MGLQRRQSDTADIRSQVQESDSVMYGVQAMQRTNIYLDEQQMTALRQLADQRGLPMAVLVRQAVDAWLAGQGVRVITEDEWQQRFARLIDRRGSVATKGRFDAALVASDVAAALKEVRETRAARRR